MNLSPLIHNCH